MHAIGLIFELALSVVGVAVVATMIVSTIEAARYWRKAERRELEMRRLREEGVRKAIREILLTPVESPHDHSRRDVAHHA